MINLGQAALFGTSFLFSGQPWVFPEESSTNGSLEFGKSFPSSYLRYEPDNDFDFGTGEFTIEWWQFLQESTRSRFPRVFSIGNYEDPGGAKIAVSIEDSNLYFWVNGTIVFSNFISDFLYNDWNHFAITRDSNDSIRLYRNGTLIGDTTNTSSIGSNSMDLFIGNESTEPSFIDSSFRGYLVDFHWVKGSSLYSGESFALPTDSITPDANTKLLLNAIDDFDFLKDSSTVDRVAAGIQEVFWAPYSPY